MSATSSKKSRSSTTSSRLSKTRPRRWKRKAARCFPPIPAPPRSSNPWTSSRRHLRRASSLSPANPSPAVTHRRHLRLPRLVQPAVLRAESVAALRIVRAASGPEEIAEAVSVVAAGVDVAEAAVDAAAIAVSVVNFPHPSTLHLGHPKITRANRERPRGIFLSCYRENLSRSSKSAALGMLPLR